MDSYYKNRKRGDQMIDDLMDLHIILLGGDKREVTLYHCWKEAGISIKMAGFNKCSQIPAEDMVTVSDAGKAHVFIAPLSGVKPDGTVRAMYTDNRTLQVRPYLEKGKGKKLLMSGSVDPGFKPGLPANITVHLTADDPELALLNAVPTAEGAIQKAMELSEITLHAGTALVIGYGRCGSVLAGKLKALNAQVTAVIRRREKEAEALACGIDAVYTASMSDAVSGSDYIFNTVPSMILDSGMLEKVKQESVIIDLASAPGGTDFKAAEELGLKALLLPGIPGKAAPRTAGEILCRVYPKLIQAYYTHY